jgi:hypothetical protein
MAELIKGRPRWLRIRSADGNRRAWFSTGEEPTEQQDGELGEHIDTGQKLVFWDGKWHKQVPSVEPWLKPYFDNAVTSTKLGMKISAGFIHMLEVSNPNVVDSFLQLFDYDLSRVTVGTTTPTYSFLVPAGGGTLNRGAFDRLFPVPLRFSKAIVYAATTTPAGSTAPTNNLTLNAGYA